MRIAYCVNPKEPLRPQRLCGEIINIFALFALLCVFAVKWSLVYRLSSTNLPLSERVVQSLDLGDHAIEGEVSLDVCLAFAGEG